MKSFALLAATLLISIAFVPMSVALPQDPVPVGLEDNQGALETAPLEIGGFQELSEALFHSGEGQPRQPHQEDPDAGAVVEVVLPTEVQVGRDDHAVPHDRPLDDGLVGPSPVGRDGQMLRVVAEFREDPAKAQGNVLVEEEPQGPTPSRVEEFPAEELGRVRHGGGDVVVRELWVFPEDLLASVAPCEQLHDQVDGDARPPDDRLPCQHLGIRGDPVVHRVIILEASYELAGGPWDQATRTS